MTNRRCALPAPQDRRRGSAGTHVAYRTFDWIKKRVSWESGKRIWGNGKGKAVSAALETLPLVLVSASPLCRQVLSAAGFAFDAVEPGADEPASLSGHVGPVQQAEAVAYCRAREVADRQPHASVLAVKTLVAIGKRVFGRPFGRLEAADMLRAVSGRRHTVVTGAAIVQPGHRLIASDVTHVTMRPIPEEVVRWHLDSGNWLGVAGAYATPEMAERFVLRLEGSFSNVLGLPVELVDRMIAELYRHPEHHECL